MTKAVIPMERTTGDPKLVPMGRKVPSRKGEAPGIAGRVIRERCRRGFASRIHVLEGIADGSMTYTVKGPKGSTTYEPTARDRVAALESLARYGGVALDDVESQNGQQWRTAEALSKALLGALSDPSVRRWLLQERPEILGALAAGAAASTAAALQNDGTQGEAGEAPDYGQIVIEQAP